MSRPNMIGTKLFFPGTAVNNFAVTNVQVAAIDSATTSDDIYPNAYTATLSAERDSRSVLGIATDIVLVTASKVAFGVFMSPYYNNQAALFSLHGCCKFFGDNDTTAALKVYPFFGQVVNTTVTQSVAAASNQCSNNIILPHFSDSTANAATSQKTISVKEEIIKEYLSTNTKPVVFGFCIENPTAGSLQIKGLKMYMSIQKYIQDIDVFGGTGR